MLDYAWVITIMPLAAFCIILGLTYRKPMTSALVAIICMGISLVFSVGVLLEVIAGRQVELSLTWFTLGDWRLEVGVLVDPLAAVMFLVVTLITFLDMIYSIGYMHGDAGFSRFFAFLSLFAFSMLGLVSANNFLQIFMGWELVGLCSYLLIGFWYDQPGVALPPASAGMRAFIVTRIGDVGFLIGILMLAAAIPTLNFGEVFAAAQAGQLSTGLVTVAAILLFAGAVGKSAQFPLHVWLPDAMEGPTPVSALIHAATMVAAGVFLVARVMPIFNAGPEALTVVAYIGGFTALLAATIALNFPDFKRVIAYSTISQLGYMFMALGITGAATAGIFHLTTHAFFKALLFLAMGSVIHAAGSQHMKDLGGLRKYMPVTSFTFLMGALALSGIPPFSGFWSKDEIILSAVENGQTGLAVLGLLVAFFTGLYIFRVYFGTFSGEVPEHRREHHFHESPATMTIPLVVLAIMAIAAGWVGTPWANYFAAFLEPEAHHAEVDSTAITLMIISTCIAVLAVITAWAIYGRKHVADLDQEPLGKAVPWLQKFLVNKWYIEPFYYGVIVRYAGVGLSVVCAWFDRHVIDGIVNGIAAVVGGVGLGLRRVQSGYLQLYAMVTFAAIVIVAVYLALFVTG